MATTETPKVMQLRGIFPRLSDASWAQMKEYAPTFLAEFAVMASQILVYKLAAHYLGTLGFSEYAVARRTISLLQPVVLLGIGLGLPRYIAMAEASGDLDRVRRLFGAASWCVGAAVGVLALALIVWRNWFSYLFFGNKDYAHFLPALSLMLLGLSMHSLCYAFLRGRMAISRANALNLVNLGVVPVLAFLWFRGSAGSVLWGLGICWTAIGAIALLWMPLGAPFRRHPQELKELLGYGIQRVPGDFALMGLLAFPALFAAHTSGVERAGYVAFGISFTNMIAAMFAPVGIILLPKISRNLGLRNFTEIRKEVMLVGWCTAGVSAVLVGLAEAFAYPAMRIYLGASFWAAIGPMRIAVVGALPLAFYYGLRNAIDALRRKAVNTINLLVTLVFYFLLSELFSVTTGIRDCVLWSFVMAAFLLAILTALEVRKMLRQRVELVLESDNELGTEGVL